MPERKLNEGKRIQVKCDPVYFDAVEQGRKTLEIRFNDRDYQCGDVLHMLRWDRNNPPKENEKPKDLYRDITHVLSGAPFLPEGYVALSIVERY